MRMHVCVQMHMRMPVHVSLNVCMCHARALHTHIRLVSVPLRRRATHVHAHAYVYAPLQARHAPSQLPSGLPFRCTQGPGDLLLLPPLWGHATKNLGFNIGIGDLYCDSRLANQARK